MKDLKVKQLKEELAKRGLKTNGLKKDLVKRLTDAIQQEAAETQVILF